MLYVAATRAREQLIINGTIDLSSKGQPARLGDWFEETFDLGRQQAIKSGTIYGVKKSQVVNSASATVDYATITLSSMETRI